MQPKGSGRDELMNERYYLSLDLTSPHSVS